LVFEKFFGLFYAFFFNFTLQISEKKMTAQNFEPKDIFLSF